MKHLDLPKLRILQLSYSALRGSDSSTTTVTSPYYYTNSLTMRSSFVAFIIIRSSFSCKTDIL